MINRFKKSWYVYCIFLLVSCLVYIPVLGKKARNPDAGIILPPLFEIRNPLEYLAMLADFQVIDFQPVRDLSFFFDITIFRITGLVSFTTTNILLWSVAMYFLYRLLEKIVPLERRAGVIVWSLAFTVYPLFSQVIPWGMARKHILAFLFILWTTLSFLAWMEGKQGFFRHYLGYVLSALSHPITILWPVWAFIHFSMFADPEKKSERRKFVIYLLTGVTLLFTNYAYYTVGNQRVSEAFGNVRPDYFDLGKNLIHFAFYFRQIIWPYQLGFMNYPELSNSWPGLLCFLLFAIFVFIHRNDRRLLSWALFALFPFPIFVSLPGVFDQYLLIPVAGIVLLLALHVHRPTKKHVLVLSLLTIVWGGMTFYEASIWVDAKKIARRNYENSPSCKSAAEVLLNHYKEKEKSPPHILEYFLNSNCIRFNPDVPVNMRMSYVNIESLLLFYETERFSYEQRVERLKELSEYNYYPNLVLSALYSSTGKNEEIEEIANHIITRTHGMKLETGPVIDDVLRPYCEKHKLEACLKVTKPNRVELPYL